MNPEKPRNWSATATLGGELARRVEAGTPTSLIRLGDGEGVILGMPDMTHRLAGPYLQSHFGTAFGQPDLLELQAGLLRATQRAWAIGLREDVIACQLPPDALSLCEAELTALMKEQTALRAVERARMDSESAWRLALLHKVLTRQLHPDAVLTSAWCHFDWLESGRLADLVTRQGHIGLVSGHATLAERLRISGIQVDFWPVPKRYIRRDAEWQPHFPDRFAQLRDSLAPAFPGQVMLVGAGIPGKVYCDLIAERGGIGIDIGAVCDAWIGQGSRPLVSQTRWCRDDIPAELLIENQLGNRARVRRRYPH